MALILIVDDDPAFRNMLAMHVSEMGHEVILASDGAEGLDIAKAQTPHVIVSDIMMPEMDGVEFNALLKLDPVTKDIPVLMLTGNIDKQVEVGRNYSSTFSFEYIIGKMAPIEQIADVLKEILYKYYQI